VSEKTIRVVPAANTEVQLSSFLENLPPDLRERMYLDFRLWPGLSRGTAPGFADTLDVPVEIRADGLTRQPPNSVAVSLDGRRTFKPFAHAYRVHPPTQAVLAPHLPMDLRPGGEPGTYALPEGWVLQVLDDGLLVRPPTVTDEFMETLTSRPRDLPRLTVGAPGASAPDGVWRYIQGLVSSLPAETRGHLVIEAFSSAPATDDGAHPIAITGETTSERQQMTLIELARLGELGLADYLAEGDQSTRRIMLMQPLGRAKANAELLRALVDLAHSHKAWSTAKGSERADVNVLEALANVFRGLPLGIDRSLVPSFISNRFRVLWLGFITQQIGLHAGNAELGANLKKVAIAVLTC
jgi:hypothetical protein